MAGLLEGRRVARERVERAGKVEVNGFQRVAQHGAQPGRGRAADDGGHVRVFGLLDPDDEVADPHRVDRLPRIDGEGVADEVLDRREHP